MANITANIIIDFNTDKDITQEQFDLFKKQLQRIVYDDIEMIIYDTAHECGFEADSFHPISLDGVDCDFDS